MASNRTPRRGLSLILALLALATLALDVPEVPIITEEEAVHVPWTDELPPLPAGYEDTTENLCKQGQTKCVDVVIKEMTRRFKRLAADCRHNAVFSLAYLRTTEQYRKTIQDPSFFDDTPFVNHFDVVFAAYYFEAYDNWYSKSGNPRSVPAAWRVAFDASDQLAVSGAGSLLLGMNAHVNHDLPFVLAALGIVAPDGTSRKRDHDQVNQFLVKVVEPVINEAAARFDPTIKYGSVDGTSLDESATFQLLVGWREEAWRNAERLVNAGSASERAGVAESIEESAATKALMLRAQYGYVPLVSSSAMRDAWCAQHGGGR